MTPEKTRPQRGGEGTRPSGATTRPVRPGAEPPPQRGRGVPWRLILALLVAALFILFAAAGSGFLAGTSQREAELAAQEEALLQEQFDRGVVDLEEGRLQVAKQRFEYILEVNPDYPGARDLLTLAQQGLNEPTATPSPTATEVILTPTPTLSLQTLDGQLEAARAANEREAWDEAIELLLSLRRKDPEYRLDEVNSLLFAAYRNRGLAKIFRKDLAQGIYDLSLASRIGTLDNQAQSWRRSASFYQYANSFIRLDWQEATSQFADLCSAGLWDSCFKYARSAREYGHLLLEDEEYCAAARQYQRSLDTRESDDLEPTATYAYESCLTATATPPTATPTITATLTTVTPFTPTATSVPSDTPAGPTNTPEPATETPTVSVTSTPTPTTGAASPTPTETPPPASATPTPEPPTPTETPTES